MLSISLRFLRPAAELRRRSFVFLAACAAVLSAFTIRPQDPTAPALATTSIQSVALRAARTIRPEQPENARYIERLVSEAVRIDAHEKALPNWQRTPDRAEEAWLRVLRLTREARNSQRQRDHDQQDRWVSLSPRLESELRQAQAQLARGGGLGYREAKALRSALFHHDLAIAQAKNGQIHLAADSAEAALALVGVVDSGYAALHSRFADPAARRRWRGWVDESIDQSRKSGAVVIVVDKLARKLEVYGGGKKLATYAAELGANGLKPKRYAGDKATPEGRYRVTEVRGPNATQFYKALMLSYPNTEDRARFELARRRGEIPQRAGIGSLIEIHGEGGEGKDWTDGCVALRNRDMDSLFRYARVGTPVTIVGTLGR